MISLKQAKPFHQNSVQDVERIALEPKCPHIALAQLSVEDAAMNVEKAVAAILKRQELTSVTRMTPDV